MNDHNLLIFMNQLYCGRILMRIMVFSTMEFISIKLKIKFLLKFFHKQLFPFLKGSILEFRHPDTCLSGKYDMTICWIWYIYVKGRFQKLAWLSQLYGGSLGKNNQIKESREFISLWRPLLWKPGTNLILQGQTLLLT